MDSKCPSDQDRALLERIQSGDDQAIALLYDRYASVVYSIAHRVLQDASLAEQVLSDVFLEIWRSPKRLVPFKGSVCFWLLMLARNRAFAARQHKPVSDGDVAPSDWPANCTERIMTSEEARAAIAQLPKERRVMLEKAFFDETNSVARTEDLLTEAAASTLAGSGLVVSDLESDSGFAHRQLHVRDAVLHKEGMNRLAQVFAEDANTILQELVIAAVELCGADSAGISVVEEDSTDERYYHWVAVAGQYSGFLNARLPRYPSACGVTLERDRPQVFRVGQRFFDLMRIQAPTVTDGLLFPWRAGETRGTIWVLAHGRDEAFDKEDSRMMQALADFAATGVKLQQRH